MPKYDTVSFLSDMGTTDESVGVCKAVILQQAPHVHIIDISHDVAPFDVRAGALALTRAIQFLPKGIVIAAVDPGSPKDQRYIAVEMEEGILIGPDNGILAPAAQLIGTPKRVVALANEEYRIEAPGHVFAARDILAPAAGMLASGTDIAVLGPIVPLEELVPGMLQLSRHDEGGAFLGEVWSQDRFGNIQINITPEELALRNVKVGDSVTLRVGTKDYLAKYVERYADLAISQLGILVDSTGMISIVKNLDFASRELETKEGKEVIILPQGATITGRDVTVDMFSEDAQGGGESLTPTVDTTPLSPVVDSQLGQAQIPPTTFPQQSTPVSTQAPSPFEQQAPPADQLAAPPSSQTFSNPYEQQHTQSTGSGVVDPFARPAVADQPGGSGVVDPFARPAVTDLPGGSGVVDPFARPAVPSPPADVAQPQSSPTLPQTYPQDNQQASPPPVGSFGSQSVPVPQPPVPQNPYGDSPAYFPPPVEEPSAQQVDVAPINTSPTQSDQTVSLPHNVFDLFKDNDQDNQDPNQNPNQ